MKISRIVLASACLCAVASPAWASQSPSCPVPTDAQAHGFPGGTDGAVVAALQDSLGTADIAPPGGAFNATDVVLEGDTSPSYRVAFVWQRASRWVIAVEHGGRGYSVQIMAFDAGADGRAVLVHQDTAWDDTCQVAEQALQ